MCKIFWVEVFVLVYNILKPAWSLEALISQGMTLKTIIFVIFQKFFVECPYFLHLRHLADYHSHLWQGDSVLQILQNKCDTEWHTSHFHTDYSACQYIVLLLLSGCNSSISSTDLQIWIHSDCILVLTKTVLGKHFLNQN